MLGCIADTNMLTDTAIRALKADSRTAARVWQLSQGIPRRVVRLVELLLVAGASDRSSLLGPHTVDAVHRELVPAA